MTYNARYKHEHSHFKLPYVCHYCEKRFLFPALRTKHENLHTGKRLLPCMWPGCKQQLSCKDALQQHINTHTEERFMCDKCNKTFNTITNLKQHEKGKHGEGHIALCGAVYDWSDGRNNHQMDCDDCKALQEQKNSLPEKPGKKGNGNQVWQKITQRNTFGKKNKHKMVVQRMTILNVLCFLLT